MVRILGGAVAGFVLSLGLQLFVQGRRLGDVTETVGRISDQLSGLAQSLRPELDAVIKRREQLRPWPSDLSGRLNLSVAGMSLRSFTNEHLGSVAEILVRGGSCRLLFIEPESPASAVAAKHLLGSPDASDYNKEVSWSIRRALEINSRYPESLSIRTIDHILAAGVAMLDSGLPSAKIYVELYTYEKSSARRPHLEMTPASSPVWYSYFEEQFERMWKQGKERTAAGEPAVSP
jgi:hypothetical protein